MKLYRLHFKQFLPISKNDAWDFLSDPKNLAKITPKHMDFQIISGADRDIFAGQIISYTVKPFSFYKTQWVTEITHVTEGEYFVDEQRFGPYALWHHKHFLKERGSGVEMEDIVDYVLPFGFLGRFAHNLFLKRQLNQVFEFRKKQLEKLFVSDKSAEGNLVLKPI